MRHPFYTQKHGPRQKSSWPALQCCPHTQTTGRVFSSSRAKVREDPSPGPGCWKSQNSADPRGIFPHCPRGICREKEKCSGWEVAFSLAVKLSQTRTPGLPHQTGSPAASLSPRRPAVVACMLTAFWHAKTDVAPAVREVDCNTTPLKTPILTLSFLCSPFLLRFQNT